MSFRSKIRIVWVVVAFVAIWFTSCRTVKYVPDNQFLLSKSKIMVDSKTISIIELKTYLKQRPNTRILGFWRFHLGLYNLSSKNDTNGIFKRIGEAPVIYSDYLSQRSKDEFVRAFDGGVGSAKAAGNYGASMLPTKEAYAQGYHQVMWMDGHEFKYVEETGTTNVFFVIGDKILTPALDGNILDGVTRKSCIALLKEEGATVEEKRVDINEIIEAYKNGELKDAFCTGTAASVVHIELFNYKGQDIVLPPVAERKWSNFLHNKLDAIKGGKSSDTHDWIVEVVNENIGVSA